MLSWREPHNIEKPITMTLDMGSPFKIITKPYVITAVDQASPAGTVSKVDMSNHELKNVSPGGVSKRRILILVIIIFLVGIVMWAKCGKTKGGK